MATDGRAGDDRLPDSRRTSPHHPGRRRPGYHRTTTMEATMPPLEQGGLPGFNGVVFGSGASTGVADLDPPALRQRPSANAVGEQIQALQRENQLLRRTNQDLVASTEARQQAATRLLGDLALSPDDRRKQLTQVLMALLEPADEESSMPEREPTIAAPSPPLPPPLRPASTARSGETRRFPMLDNVAQQQSRPVSRDAAGHRLTAATAALAAADWDADALSEMASQGRVAQDETRGDRYAAESRKAIGGHSFVGRQQRLSINRKQPKQQRRRSSSSSSGSSSSSSSSHSTAPSDSGDVHRAPSCGGGGGGGGGKSTTEAMHEYGDVQEEKMGALAMSLLEPDEDRFVQDADARFVLYSPTAGIFQAPTLDTLRSGDMTLADIIEASSKSISLEQLRRDRIAEQEAVRAADATSGDSDSENVLSIASQKPKSAARAAPEPPTYSGAGCFWLDITEATAEEMASLARVFGIHPLTVEDIMTEDEGRDKFESFSGYSFIVYRTLDYDGQAYGSGGQGISTASFSIILKQSCVLTFHRPRELSHVASVVGRLRDLVSPDSPFPVVTPAYIAYALIDDITDTLTPEMRSVELDVDAADELVLILSTSEQSDMLQRIGAARRKILTLWRLLQGKPEVIRAFSKLMDRQAHVDEFVVGRGEYDDVVCEYPQALDGLSRSPSAVVVGGGGLGMVRRSTSATVGLQQAGRRKEAALWPAALLKERPSRPSTVDLAPRDTEGLVEWAVTADEVSHYLSDVFDHLASLVGSASHCDMVLTRAHSNYLARLSLALGETTVETNLFASRWTVIGAILVPLNVITGLWGMNVKVPGQDREDLRDFFLILAGCLAFVVLVIVWARYRKIF
ncbi:CorA metal ion transporter [Coemansia sp. RSA 552]|nr:CorA metal ion transporter [Coemansia sp. RSA 552]